MDANLLNDFVENTRATINNVLVLKDGEKIAAYNWEPEICQNQYL